MVSLMLRARRDELIYLAGPLFSEAERRFNLELTHRLEVIGFDVSLQQRVERNRPPYDTMTPEERRHTMNRLDVTRILDADVFVFDGRVPDEGACVMSSASPNARSTSRTAKSSSWGSTPTPG